MHDSRPPNSFDWCELTRVAPPRGSLGLALRSVTSVRRAEMLTDGSLLSEVLVLSPMRKAMPTVSLT